MVPERIRDYLSYDPVTGRFDWIVRPRGCVRLKPGAEAGALRPDGYRTIQFEGRPYLAHHLAWWFTHGVLPKEIDHKDQNPSNNAISNLRLCNRSQNGANQRRHKRGNKRFRGVYPHPKGGWSARICVNYNKMHIGYYQSEEAAARAYDAAARQHFGEYARCNFEEGS